MERGDGVGPPGDAGEVTLDRASLLVRDVREADLDAVAELHVQAFPTSVLGALGVDAVRRNYQWQLDGPHDLTAIVAESQGRIVGFLFGGVFRGSTIGFVKREKWFLARRVMTRPRILLGRIGWKRTALALRLLLRRPARPEPERPDAVPRRSFGVLSIAVDPGCQGLGVGRALMAVARERATERGFEAMHLSVHPSNQRGVSFYRGLGWSESPEPDGKWVGRMSIALDR